MNKLPEKREPSIHMSIGFCFKMVDSFMPRVSLEMDECGPRYMKVSFSQLNMKVLIDSIPKRDVSDWNSSNSRVFDDRIYWPVH